MPLSERDNWLRSVRMTGPEWIPCSVRLPDALWLLHREGLEEIVLRHPWLYPDYERGSIDFENFDPGLGKRAGERFTDNWGCVWENKVEGIWGQCVGNPLDHWDELDGLWIPDVETQDDYKSRNWKSIRQDVEDNQETGKINVGVVGRYLFSRLWYLRGFENLMIDFGTSDPRLQKLVDIIVDYRLSEVQRYLAMDVDQMNFGDDFGTQRESFISPLAFHQWITPALKHLFEPCREQGCIVHVHSDGYIMELVDDIIGAGADIINPQDLCNGIDDLVKNVKGRICINLDIDRQTVVPFGSPQDIDDLIKEEVMKLGSSEGGLQFICGVYPPTPLANINALLEALEKYRFFWSGK